MARRRTVARGRYPTNTIRWNINLQIDVAKTIRAIAAAIVLLVATCHTIPYIRPAIVRYVHSAMAADAPVDPQLASGGRWCFHDHTPDRYRDRPPARTRPKPVQPAVALPVRIVHSPSKRQWDALIRFLQLTGRDNDQ